MRALFRSLTLPVILFGCLLGPIWHAGAADAPINADAPTIRVDVGLVHVPVTVTGPLGNPVSNLTSSDFEVFEDGAGRSIQYFSSQDTPVSIGILFDASGSMQTQLREAREAVARLLRSGMQGDEYFLIAFSDRARLIVPPERGSDEILRRLGRIRAGGWTALLDAAHLGLTTMRRTHNVRKALIVLSDGADNRSRFTQTEILDLVRESDASVYALGLAGEGQSDANLRLLADLAEETGGRMLPVASPADLPAAIEQISRSVRNQYLLGFSPVMPYDGRYRTVTVKLTRPSSERLHASWRTGYRSPGPELP
jgi:Ca-activated chloride channel homolog